MAQFLQNNRIRSFCCGCDVRTGSLVIAVFELLGTIFQIVNLIVPFEADISKDPTSYGLVITSCTVSVIVCLSLAWGIYTNSKNFLLPWLILRGLSWFAVNILIGVLIIQAILLATYALFIGVFIFILTSVLTYYFWRCVVSFYFELAERDTIQHHV